MSTECFIYLFLSPLLRHQQAQLGDNQYESVDRVEAAKLLGTPDSGNSRPVTKNKDEYESPSANCEYAVVNKRDRKVSGALDKVKQFRVIRSSLNYPFCFFISFYRSFVRSFFLEFLFCLSVLGGLFIIIFFYSNTNNVSVPWSFVCLPA